MQMNPGNDCFCEYFQILVGRNEMSKISKYLSDSFTYLYVYFFFKFCMLGII